MSRIARNITVMVAMVAFAACGVLGASNDRSRPPGGETQAGRPIKGDGSPEAKLLGFLNVANKGDFEGGRLAQERGSSTAVKTYGRRMETDHMQMLQDSEAAAQRMGVLPVMGPETQRLVADHTQTTEKLQTLSGKEFDRLYLSHEIEMHERVLETAGSLLRQTQDPQLKQMVANARPLLEAHLHAAQQLMADEQ